MNEKEILELFGVGKGPIRHPIEVSRLVDRRLDYVQQNVSTISKQVEKVESQLSEVLEEMDREDDASLEPGLPITEIIEELDEDGNIIVAPAEIIQGADESDIILGDESEDDLEEADEMSDELEDDEEPSDDSEA